MIYKEWIGVRLKFYLWTGLYVVLALLQLTVWSPYQEVPAYHYLAWKAPMYTNWFWISLAATCFGALLGGIDLVSDEVDKGTLSFLLTRSISRKRIYSTKIMLNCAAWATAYGVMSAAILIIDHFQPQPIDLLEGALLWLLGFAPGIGIICLAGLVSVFTRNMQQTLVGTVAIPLLIGAFCVFTGQWFVGTVWRWFSSVVEYAYYTLRIPFELISGILVGGIATLIIGMLSGLFWAGMVSFAHKEF